MIVLPPSGVPTSIGRRGFEAFCETGASRELAGSPERWHLVAWPWTAEPPLRLVLENDAHEAVAFTLDDDGVWRLEPEPRVLRTRSEESLREEAWGDTSEDFDPLQ